MTLNKRNQALPKEAQGLLIFLSRREKTIRGAPLRGLQSRKATC